MSNNLFPTLPGIAWPVQRTVMAPPVTVKTTPSQREFRARDSTIPRYKFALTFEFLRPDAALLEWQTLLGFFNLQGGPFDDFIFVDASDSTVTNQAIGVGDGVTTQFQLARTMGGFLDPVYAPNGTQVIKVAGGVVTPTSISATGLVTLATAPTAGQTVSWTGGFGWRCRFADENATFEQLQSNFWTLKKIDIITVKPL